MTVERPSLGRVTAGCFILGSDTEVGKTFQAVALAHHLTSLGKSVGVYKPVASGVSDAEPSDPQLLYEAAKLTCEISRVCPQQFALPLAPPVAARLQGRQVDEQLMLDGIHWWRSRCEYLIVEGVGGVLSPISETMTFLDFMLQTQLGFPCVIIASNRLGTVNHTLLTLRAVAERGLTVAGIVLNTPPKASPENDPSVSSNLELLRSFAGDTPVEADAEKIWQLLDCGGDQREVSK